MSLHALATNMASKGRNGDSMLVHMTPGEVHGLQALAMKHGGSLTINPDTGLPEANFLKSLLPMLAGFALGPAGFGLVSSGLTAGAIVGGVTGLATGSLSKGLMAGLGAYGGFGIGESLAGLGAGELAQGQISANMPTLAEGASQTQIADYAKQVNDLRTAGLQGASQLPMADKLSAGFSSASASPMDAFNFAKDNKMALGMAAAPIMADMMVPTTTKMPTNTNPAYIRQYVTGDRPQAPRALTPVLASEFGSRNFSDAYASPMATGGIVALAGGGAVPGYAIGGDLKGVLENEYATAQNTGDYSRVNDLIAQNKISEADVSNTWSGFDTAGAAGLGVNYFAQNPDVAAAFADNSYGMDADTFAQTHFDKFGQGEGRTLGGTGSGAPVDYFANQFAPDVFAPVTNTGTGGITNLTGGGGGGSDIKFGPGDELINAGGGGGGGLPALNTAATNPYYFQVNPDVAAEYARNPMGLTPEQFAQAHYTNFGKKEGREFEPSAAVNYATANKTDIVANTLKWIDTNPLATPDQINAAIKGSGMSTGDVNRTLDSLVASGKITQSERFYIQQGKGLSGMADSTAEWLKKHPDATQTQIDAVLKAANMDTGDAQRIFEHGFQVADKDLTAATKYIQDNPDVARWITSDQGKAYIKDHPEFDAKDIAFTHYKRYGEKEGRKWGADTTKTTTTTTNTNTVTGVTGGPPTTTVLPTNPQTNAPPGTTNPYGNINNPGDLTFNNDGTVTVQPNIPGRPYGGFSGITELTKAYTAGGGSTGYVPYVPKTAAEHDALYNTQTDDSLDAYNYLMGKAGSKYPSKSRASEIMKPYEEAVLGYAADPTKKKFINVGGKMVKNPQYVEPTSKITKPGDPNVIPKETPREGYQWGWNEKNKKWEEIPVTAVDNSGGGGGEGPGPGPGPGPGDGGIGTGPGTAKNGGLMGYALGGLGTLGGYSDGGRLLKGPGDGVSDSIPATIGRKQQPARLADGEFVIPARIVSELGNGSTDAGARKLYAMMDRVQRARGKTTGKNRVAANSRSDKYLPA